MTKVSLAVYKQARQCVLLYQLLTGASWLNGYDTRPPRGQPGFDSRCLLQRGVNLFNKSLCWDQLKNTPDLGIRVSHGADKVPGLIVIAGHLAHTLSCSTPQL